MKTSTLLSWIFLFGLISSLSAQESGITLELFSSGFERPLDLQHAGDNRIFIVEQGGKIKIIQEDGSINPTPFLDISSKISTGEERGLLGLAFHPEYQENGYFYVNYTNLDGDTRVVRYSVDPNNANLSLPDSDLLILNYEQPYANHNGGHMLFGPDGVFPETDGNLYIASGDGGGSGDPDGNAQNINSFLGKILRIDVDNPSNGKNYGIPSTNPFVGMQDVKEEIWAYGLRNPWRFTIWDLNVDIIIADVGQNQLEEINWQDNDLAGLNYGWPCFEGSQPYNLTNCPPSVDLTFPITEYSHTDGNCSITGGMVREVGFPEINSLYFFADFCSGMIGSVNSENAYVTNYGNFPGSWVSFGVDYRDDFYIVDISDGKIFKIDTFPLSAENFDMDYRVKIFPNPASEILTIQILHDNIEAIKIYDTKGLLVLEEKKSFGSETRISIADLSKGFYFIEILSDKGNSIRKKLIIE